MVEEYHLLGVHAGVEEIVTKNAPFVFRFLSRKRSIFFVKGHLDDGCFALFAFFVQQVDICSHDEQNGWDQGDWVSYHEPLRRGKRQTGSCCS